MYPESTAALEAPTAALSLSAKSYNNLKLSEFSSPLPPDTTTRALPNSGLSLFDTSLLTNVVLTSESMKEIFSTAASPPVSSHFSKEVGLTVIKLIF